MKLTTRSRYGLRAIIYIAKKNHGLPIPLSEIATELNLSDNYLEHLLRMMRNSGFLESIRGAAGGYRLIKDPREIIVGDILRLLEGSLWLSDCASEGECPQGNVECATRFITRKISESIQSTVDSITLQQLVDHEQSI